MLWDMERFNALLRCELKPTRSWRWVNRACFALVCLGFSVLMAASAWGGL